MSKFSPATVAVYLSVAFLIPCQAAERIALVIGNNIYDAGQAPGTGPNLANAISDSRLVAKTLKSLGFEVVTMENAGVDAIYEGLVTFQEKAKKSSLGVFYFAGHGIEVDGKNYIIPVDAKLESKGQIRSQTVGLEAILRDMGDTGNKGPKW